MTCCCCCRREALNSGDFEAAAGYVDTFIDLEEKYGPVRDGDGQQAVEQEQVSSNTPTYICAICSSFLWTGPFIVARNATPMTFCASQKQLQWSSAA